MRSLAWVILERYREGGGSGKIEGVISASFEGEGKIFSGQPHKLQQLFFNIYFIIKLYISSQLLCPLSVPLAHALHILTSFGNGQIHSTHFTVKTSP